MKIRIKGNTVRYRLSKSEITHLAKTGRLEEKTEFPQGSLTYAIEQSALQTLSGAFSGDTITLLVPAGLLEQWCGSDQIGLEHALSLSSGNSLYLLLEKDFKCIDAAVKEDQSDYFENPLLTC